MLGNSFIALTWKISFEHQMHIMHTKLSSIMQLYWLTAIVTEQLPVWVVLSMTNQYD